VKPNPSTPICPACGAKFAHDAVHGACRKCGLPDEVADAGQKAVNRWKRSMRKIIDISTQENFFPEVHQSEHTRRRNKHGRVGVRRA
jgi:threonine synthase